MPLPPPARTGAPQRVRPDASMSLLTNVVEHSLDDGYAEAAARRTTGDGRMPRTLRAKLGLAVGLVLAASVVTVGAAQARVAAPLAAKERRQLADRVDTENAQADALQRTVNALRADVGRRQRAALHQRGDSSGTLVGLLAGATAVRGPGVKLVVDDAQVAGGGDGGLGVSDSFADTGRVRDRDMQRVVNGLWGAGAEAISVNGQRLTSLSAIRAAGDAILVDNRPLVPPYTVLAVGGKTLGRTFQDSVDGRYLRSLHGDFGIRSSLSDEHEVALPAAPTLTLRSAQPEKGTS